MTEKKVIYIKYHFSVDTVATALPQDVWLTVCSVTTQFSHYAIYSEALTHWSRDKMEAIQSDDIFKCIFFNENVWIAINISLKFVPMGPINNIPAMVQIMARCRPGDKPLSEPMMARLPTHIYIIQPRWVNNHGSSDNVSICNFFVGKKYSGSNFIKIYQLGATDNKSSSF